MIYIIIYIYIHKHAIQTIYTSIIYNDIEIDLTWSYYKCHSRSWSFKFGGCVDIHNILYYWLNVDKYKQLRQKHYLVDFISMRKSSPRVELSFSFNESLFHLSFFFVHLLFYFCHIWYVHTKYELYLKGTGCVYSWASVSFFSPPFLSNQTYKFFIFPFQPNTPTFFPFPSPPIPCKQPGPKL